MSIYILGTGAIGCHMGAILRRNKHKVTLLLRSQSHVDEFQSLKNRITYRAQGESLSIAGFDAHVAGTHNDQPIDALIVATKAHHTTEALKAVAPRLSSRTTMLLLQNGMGVAEELVETLWPQSEPPQIYVGVNLHAVERVAPYAICHHAGYNVPNALSIGLHPTSKRQERGVLVEQILRIPELNATELMWEELRVQMYKKLVVNACINPLASVLMTKNRGNIHAKAGIEIMRSVCEEFYQVFKDALPEETVDSLLDMVLEISDKAGDNINSTLQDIRAKRLTEIDYINGYICKKGREQNINVKTNELFVQLIHAKESLYDFTE